MAAISPPPTSLSARLVEIAQKISPLGFIAFGGPQVHVILFRRLFVLSKEPWLDPLTFADLFALSGSLPGPGSTQLLFSIGLIRGGAFAGILAFFFWS
jgi:chromate transport protein ChrA